PVGGVDPDGEVRRVLEEIDHEEQQDRDDSPEHGFAQQVQEPRGEGGGGRVHAAVSPVLGPEGPSSGRPGRSSSGPASSWCPAMRSTTIWAVTPGPLTISPIFARSLRTTTRS